MQPLTPDSINIPQTDPPLISVILPVFNAEKYIRVAVNSILDQTLTDFELIIINDGSTDNTLIILRNFANRDNRIRIVTRANRGLVESLNEGIDLTRGKWIARMDADDIALPYRFERQLQWLVETGADITGSWTQLFGTHDRRKVKHAQTDAAIKIEMLFGSPFAHPTVMMRTVLAKQLRYDKTWEKAEDYDLWERAARAGWIMTNVPEVLLLYRQHKAQISSIANNIQKENTNKIRRRYWQTMKNILPISSQDIDNVLKIYEQPNAIIDMNKVDVLFLYLFQHTKEESRDIVIYYAFRFYLKTTGTDKNTLMHWGYLCNMMGRKVTFHENLSLLLLQTFRVTTNGVLLKFLRAINNTLGK